MKTQEERVELNKTLNFIKKLILNGYSDDTFGWIQEHMTNVQPHVDPQAYRRLGEFVRSAYTDSVDVKELNQLIRYMKVDEELKVD